MHSLSNVKVTLNFNLNLTSSSRLFVCRVKASQNPKLDGFEVAGRTNKWSVAEQEAKEKRESLIVIQL